MEQALIRSETVADIAPVSNITSSWSSNDSLSGWIVSPSSTSDETQPRALRSSSQSMYYHDSSYHVPSFSIPGEGTDLSGSQVMSESYSLADTRLDHNLAHYNAKHDEKHDSSYLHSTPSDDHYGDTHYSYHPSTRTQILHHRSNHVQPAIYNHTNGWAHSPVMTSSSQQATTTFPYSDTREGNSPFLSSEPSPRDHTHQRIPSFPDSNHSNDMYPTIPLLSPLHPSIHGGDDHHYTSDFLHEQHTPKRFVNMSDIAGLHGAPGSDFGSDYAHCQISPVDPGPDGTISLASLDDASEEYAEGLMNDHKRKRTGSDADDEGAGDSEAGESVHSFSSSSSKRARVDNVGSRGRTRKSTTFTQLSLTVVDSPEEKTKSFIPDAEPNFDFGHAVDEHEDKFDGDEVVYDDDDGDDDSDVYVPSRSASPRGRRVFRGSSNDSSAQRRGTRGPGSAAQALKLMESTVIGYRASPDGSTFGDISLDSKPSKPMPVPSLTKKSRGRKVPVHTSNSSGSSHGRVQYGVGAGVGTSNGYRQSSRLGLETSDMSSFYQHSTQYTHQQASSEESSNGISVAPQHGRPAKERYSSSSRAGGENESSDYGPGAKVVSGGVKKANGDRRYVCTVEGCGKCFVRGEHLKRHVRSLHTWDKPHKCPHPGCNKSFSRRDNLGQHVRVHM